MHTDLDIEVEPAVSAFDAERVRDDFPMLETRVHGKPIVYLDNAASSLKPNAMIDRLERLYSSEFANTNEQNSLSQTATEKVQQVRSSVAQLFHASSPEEIVFVRNATEAINLAAYGFGHSVLQGGDEVLITSMEHDSNVIPWQIACETSGARLRVAEVEPSGVLDLQRLERNISDRTKVIAVSQVSNVFGKIYPVREIVAIAHRRNIPVLVDGAQGAPHLPVDLQEIGCEFYAMSAHKMGGPTGVGVLYGRRDWLERLPPYQVGGVMSASMTADSHQWKPIPKKFEAGTESIAEIVAFGAAIEYWRGIGLDQISQAERELVAYACDQLKRLPRIHVLGAETERVSVVSFTVDGMDAKEVESKLDQDGIIVRGGDLNAKLLMHTLGLSGAVRASFMFYNTKHDCDALVHSLERILQV
jgi:cysteine desulfurase/selenocysteine lyase